MHFLTFGLLICMVRRANQWARSHVFKSNAIPIFCILRKFVWVHKTSNREMIFRRLQVLANCYHINIMGSEIIQCTQ